MTTPPPEGNGDARAVAIQSNGRILVAGRYYYGDGATGLSLIRHYANGFRDPSFGSGGVVTEGSGAQSVAIQSDGKIVAAEGSGQAFSVARYSGVETEGGGGSPLTDFICIQADVSDPDIDTIADTVDMYVCSSNSFVDGQCADTTLCTATGVPSGGQAQCSAENMVPVPTPHGTYNVFVFVKDNHGFQGTGTSTQGYDVEDVPPELVGYTATDAPHPSAGGSDTVDFSVSLTDANGDNDVTNIKGVFFDPAAVTHDCAANENNCYIHSICNLTGVTGTDNALGADCQVTVWFNADASNWDVQAEATDGTGNTDFADAGVSLTNPSLQGIDVTEGSISYGTIVIGGTSSGQETSMGNVGNETLDVYVSGTAMTAGSYTIPAAQQKWHHSSSTFDWDATATPDIGPFALVTLPSGTEDSGGCLNKNILVRTVHGTPDTNQSIFWKLRIPTGQQAGSYTGQNTFSTTSGNTCLSEF